MSRSKTIVATVSATTVLLLIAAPFVYAASLDRHDTRRNARRVEERECALRDRMDDWAEQNRVERFPQIELLNKRFDKFETILENYREALRTHDQPWEIRDQTQGLIGEATSLGHAVNESKFLPPGAVKDWEDLRAQVNELATHFEMPGIGAI